MPFDDPADDRNTWADQELADALAPLGTFLDNVVDVEAGLSAILAQARHDEATDALDDITDVEAGLAAILTPEEPGPLETQSPGRVTVEIRVRRPGRRRSDARRLRLRRDLAPLRRAFERALLINELTHARSDDLGEQFISTRASVLNDETEALAADLERAAERGCVPLEHIAPVMALALQITDRQRDARRTTPKVNGINAELGTLSKRLVTNYTAVVDAAVAQYCQRHQWVYLHLQDDMFRPGASRSLGSPKLIDWLFNDFTDGDLTQSTVHIEDLDGVRWSTAGTRWPAGMDTADLAARSRETVPGSGVYVVLPGPARVMA